MDIRGANSTKIRRQVFNVNKGKIELSTNLPDTQLLQAVYKYRHLGGYITYGAKLRPEIHHRIAQGHQIMKDYQTKIFRNPDIPLEHRVAIVRLTALKAALYNCGTWGKMTQHDATIWHHGLVMLYRKALARLYPWKQLMHFTDDKILCLTDALSPTVELRLARLRMYGQALQRQCPFYWTLLAMEQTWSGMLKDDSIHHHRTMWDIGPHLSLRAMVNGKDSSNALPYMQNYKHVYGLKYKISMKMYYTCFLTQELTSLGQSLRSLRKAIIVSFATHHLQTTDDGRYIPSKNMEEHILHADFKKERPAVHVDILSRRLHVWRDISEILPAALHACGTAILGGRGTPFWQSASTQIGRRSCSTMLGSQR